MSRPRLWLGKKSYLNDPQINLSLLVTIQKLEHTVTLKQNTLMPNEDPYGAGQSFSSLDCSLILSSLAHAITSTTTGWHSFLHEFTEDSKSKYDTPSWWTWAAVNVLGSYCDLLNYSHLRGSMKKAFSGPLPTMFLHVI